jgi:hypothetical protein
VDQCGPRDVGDLRGHAPLRLADGGVVPHRGEPSAGGRSLEATNRRAGSWAAPQQLPAAGDAGEGIVQRRG